MKTKFDIIIDDSTHTFQDQINVIQETYKFLVCGGILVIEDIPRNRKEYQEQRYHKYLKNYYRYFSLLISLIVIILVNFQKVGIMTKC